MMETKLTIFVTVLAASLFGMGCVSTEPAFVSDGLVAYYPFNGNAKDESGNGNDGRVEGAKLSEDRNGETDKAYGFDGNGSYIISKNNTMPSGSSSRTMTFWVRTERSNKHYENIIGWGEDIASKLFMASNNHGNLVIWGSWDNYESGLTLLPKKWNFISINYDGGNIAAYRNGKKGISSKKDWKTSSENEFGKLKLGLETTKKVYSSFKGQIDDVRIYNRALSADEVKALYDLEKPEGK